MACWIGKILSHQPFMRPRRPVLFTSPIPVRSVQSSLANRSRHRASLCFHSVTNCKFCNSFVLTFIQNAGGCTPLTSVPQSIHFRSLRTLPCSRRLIAANLHLCFQSLPRCSSHNPFLFKLLHRCRGVYVPPLLPFWRPTEKMRAL